MKRFFAILCVLSVMLALCACQEVIDLPAETEPSEEAQRVPTFVLSEGEEKVVDGETFDDEVVIGGDNAQITFLNCTFHKDIINTAEAGTKVMIVDGCRLDDGVKCIIEHEGKEATKDTPLPKFISSQSIDVVCNDCSGTAVVFFEGDPLSVSFNGTSYSVDDIEYFVVMAEDGTVTLDPYEGQEVVDVGASQWWENGAKTQICVGEYW